jgi:hypothetical protein
MNSRVQESRQNLKALDSELIDCLCKALLTELEKEKPL